MMIASRIRVLRERERGAARCPDPRRCGQVELVGDISKMEAPFGASVDTSTSVGGPIGPFARVVKLEQPVDCS